MITLRIRWRALFEPWCWLRGHQVGEYTVIHPAWNSEGRFCRRCSHQWLVKYTTPRDEHGIPLLDERGMMRRDRHEPMPRRVARG